MTRPIQPRSYYVKTEDGLLLGNLLSDLPLHIGDRVVYRGSLMEVENGNEVTVYVKKIDSVIELRDSPKRRGGKGR